MEVKDDEADCVGDLNGGNGAQSGRNGEVGMIVGVKE